MAPKEATRIVDSGETPGADVFPRPHAGMSRAPIT